jgi:hypothetical protein
MPRKPKNADISAVMRHLAAQRKTFAGGRPRIKGPRCPCKAMTLKRAKARGKGMEHDPSCAFHP